MGNPTVPDIPSFELPDPDDCYEVDDRVVLDDGHEIWVRFKLWKEWLIIEFALGQVVRHSGRWVDVCRIDTCVHGSIHKHQLVREGAPADA